MQMTDVVVKTAKGAEEIKTRAHRLPQRLRWLLIMVDGRLTVDGLLQRCQSLGDAQVALGELIAGGFVETLATGPAPATAAPAGFREAVLGLTANLQKLIGPDADKFAGAMEEASSRKEFLAALERARSIVEGVAGSDKAAAFANVGHEIADKFMPAA